MFAVFILVNLNWTETFESDRHVRTFRRSEPQQTGETDRSSRCGHSSRVGQPCVLLFCWFIKYTRQVHGDMWMCDMILTHGTTVVVRNSIVLPPSLPYRCRCRTGGNSGTEAVTCRVLQLCRTYIDKCLFWCWLVFKRSGGADSRRLSVTTGHSSRATYLVLFIRATWYLVLFESLTMHFIATTTM